MRTREAERAGLRGLGPPPPGWALLPATMAFWAWVGVAGILGDRIRFGATVTARLPWSSPVLAAVALALVVGLPMTWATALTAAGSRHARPVLLAAGLLLAGWIVVQVVVIRTFHWLQPVCLVWAAVAMAAAVAPVGGATGRRERGW